jgi:gliding motility-associated protein GldM
MAGGKQSPRDKMIGMMYLVLTALLALQVSNSVLEKFVFINRTLEGTVMENKVKNSATLESIQKAVGESGNKAEDVAVLNKAKAVREETEKVLAELEEWKNQFIQQTGGVDQDGNLVGVKDQDKVSDIMVRQGNGKKLQDRLNGYTTFLTKTTGDKVFAPLALDAKDNAVFQNDPNQKMKDFAELTFGSTPMAAGLASVSQLQTEVLARETEALEDLAKQVGASQVKFDEVRAMVRQESKVVAAGAKYRAELFIAASSSAIVPTMTVDGKDIPVVGGFGQVEFTAAPGSYDKDGYAKKTYEAAIKMSLPGGKDTIFRETIEYLVAKPVIQVQSASVSALYLNCGNDLNVFVPALGSEYKPDFRVNNGSAIKLNEGGGVRVVPTSPQDVALTVVNAGNTIGTETFKVRRIPKPDVVVRSGGREIDLKIGAKATSLRALEVVVEAEEGFKSFLPRDARYMATEYDVILARGDRPVQTLKGTGTSVNLASLITQARPGDRIVIDIKKVQRMNFRDQREDVQMGAKVITIPLN